MYSSYDPVLAEANASLAIATTKKRVATLKLTHKETSG